MLQQHSASPPVPSTAPGCSHRGETANINSDTDSIMMAFGSRNPAEGFRIQVCLNVVRHLAGH